MKVLVTIPTYNEKDNLALMVQAITSLGKEYELLIIDDNSPDGTGKLADELSENNHQLHVLHRQEKQGLAKAYLHGYSYALQNFSWDYLIQMDADFSHNPKDLPRLVEAVQTADVVVGSRYVKNGEVRYPLYRKALSFCANLFAKTILLIPIHDVTAGFRIYKRSVIEKIIIQRFFSDDYAFQVETMYYCLKHHFVVKEIPIIFVDREKGQSKINGSNILDGFLGILRLRFNHLYSFSKESKVEKAIPTSDKGALS